MTPVELRRACLGYPVSVVQSAVDAGLVACPLPPELPQEADFGALVAFWLTNTDTSLGYLPPPLPAETVAAIARYLRAAVH